MEPQTLIKIADDEYLVFDTLFNDHDTQTVKLQWAKAREEHPTWNRYDIIGYLIEEKLPRFGLKGTFLQAINLPLEG